FVDTLNVHAGTYTFDADAKLGTARLVVNVNNGTSVLFNATQHLETLNVNNGAATLAANGSRLINTNALSVTTGKLDLQDNDLIVRSGTIGTWGGSTYSGILGLVKTGRNGGLWNG